MFILLIAAECIFDYNSWKMYILIANLMKDNMMFSFDIWPNRKTQKAMVNFKVKKWVMHKSTLEGTV